MAQIPATLLFKGQRTVILENRRKGASSNEFGLFAGDIAMSGCIANDKYVATFGGKTVRFSMQPNKLASLIELIDAIEAIR